MTDPYFLEKRQKSPEKPWKNGKNGLFLPWKSGNPAEIHYKTIHYAKEEN